MMPLNDAKAEEYALHIQEIVKQLKKTSKKALEENKAFIVPPDIAKEKYGGRIGETYYLFPNEAPTKDIIDAYERVKPYGNGDDTTSFEMHLSHKQMTVLFFGNDLVIKKDREIFIDRLSEDSLHERILFAKENYIIDWNNAKFFIFPYNTAYFYISDSFERELGGGRSDLRNPDNWFTIPFKEDIDYGEITEKCKEYIKNKPLDNSDSTTLELNVNLNDLAKKAAEKGYIESHSKPTSETNCSNESSSKKSGCLFVIGLFITTMMMLQLV